MITITLTQFILISLFGMAFLVTLAMLVIIKQHRNKEEKIKKWDDTDMMYWMDDDIIIKK